MPPSRKHICDCGALERASRGADHPIRWDERLNEYFIVHGKGGRMMFHTLKLPAASLLLPWAEAVKKVDAEAP